MKLELNAQRYFSLYYPCNATLITVGGSSAQTIGGENGRNQQSKKIKILVLLKIQSFHYFYFYIGYCFVLFGLSGAGREEVVW